MVMKVTIKDSFYTKTDEKKVSEACKKAVREVLIDLVKACQDEVPIDTRNLLRSHHSETKTEGTKVTGLVKVGENARYWKYVQFGTSKMDPNPYITRALHNVEPSKALPEAFKQYFKG